MALTLADYEAVAPDVIGNTDFTANQVNNALSNVPDPLDPPVEPLMTQQKIKNLFQAVFAYSSVNIGVAKSGGWKQLAADHQLWVGQVKMLVAQMAAMVALKKADDEGGQ